MIFKYFNIKNIKQSFQIFSLKHESFGIILILLGTLLFSFRSILVKLAYLENIAVMDLLYSRFFFTLPLLWMFAFYKKKKKLFTHIKDQKTMFHCLLAGLFGYYLATLCDFHSLELIDANINRVIVYSYPIYVLVWNSILQKKAPTIKEMFCFLSVQISLYFVLGGFNFVSSPTTQKGAILASLAAISYSIYVIVNQQVGKQIGSILFTTYSITFSFIFISIHFLYAFDFSNLYQISIKGFGIIIVMAVFCTFMPLLFISEGIKRIGASRFVLLNTCGPIITIFFAFIILGEKMTYQQMIGSIFIIIILYFAEKGKR